MLLVRGFSSGRAASGRLLVSGAGRFGVSGRAPGSGLPGVSVRTLGFWRCSKEGRGAVGVRVATTGRFSILAGGLALEGRPAPNTLCRTGCTGTLCTTGASATLFSSTRTMLLWTGRALTKVSCDTAVTALGTRWFTYVTRFTVVLLLLMMVVL